MSLPHPDVQEAIEYLDSVVADYRRFVENIGNLGYAAAQLGYYRDEIQELLDALRGERGFDYKAFWSVIRKLDETLKSKASIYANEVGHKNFLQYRIINDPPPQYWWWNLDQTTPTPPAPRKFWEFWKVDESSTSPESNPNDPPQNPSEQ